MQILSLLHPQYLALVYGFPFNFPVRHEFHRIKCDSGLFFGLHGAGFTIVESFGDVTGYGSCIIFLLIAYFDWLSIL
jgi:hypothetical protein